MGESIPIVDKQNYVEHYIDTFNFPSLKTPQTEKYQRLIGHVFRYLIPQIKTYGLDENHRGNLPYHNYQHTFLECVPTIINFYEALWQESPEDVPESAIYEGIIAMAGHDVIQDRSGIQSVNTDFSDDLEFRADNEHRSADFTRSSISVAQNNIFENSGGEPLITGKRLAVIENAILGTIPQVDESGDGYYLRPTIPTDENGNSIILDKIVFGPVVQVDIGAHGLLGNKVFLEHGRKLLLERFSELREWQNRIINDQKKRNIGKIW